MMMKHLIVILTIMALLLASCAPAPVQQPTAPTPAPTPQPTPPPAEAVVEQPPAPVEQPKVEEKPAPAPTPAPTPSVQEYTIDADDFGYSMNGEKITKLEVSKGSVKLTLRVSEKNVYFGGLDFKSPEFPDQQKILPGESTTVEFDADEDFLIKSYWPLSNRFKAQLSVVVK